MIAQPFCPVSVEFITLEDLRAELERLGSSGAVVLIASRGTASRLGLDAAIEAMRSACTLTWLDASYANPTQADVAAALDAVGDVRPERIICIGGGSAIDLGKAISALHGRTVAGDTLSSVTELIASGAYKEGIDPIEIVAVPTTAGTGSEVTKWATVWDVDGKAKYSVDHVGLYPTRALVSVEATLTMPRELILATGLDALSHAMEAFWARPSTPLVKAVALDAVRHIHAGLAPGLADPQDTEAREALCLGSVLAGVAFSNTRTTACHSISYPLTMKFGVDHGFAAALTLSAVADINRSAVPQIDELLAVFSADGGFRAWIDSVSRDIRPLRLSSFGIAEGDIDTLVEMSFTAGRMDNNPVDITREQVRAILVDAL